MKIGLLAIMLNEADYVARWAAAARSRAFDRVLVVDGGSTDGTPDRLRDLDVPVLTHPFADHFADQRNWGADQIGCDWLFELDADEIPSAPLLAGIRTIVGDAVRSGVDCIGIPRINFIDNVLVAGPGHRGLDFQYRLHRRGCHWRGAVHEEVVGYRARCELLIEDGHFLVHSKTSERHALRNDYYGSIRSSCLICGTEAKGCTSSRGLPGTIPWRGRRRRRVAARPAAPWW